MADTETISPGAVINGRYVVESQIGAGGYSEVLAARDRLEDRVVALKILHSQATDHDARAVARMRQEAEILRAVDHPNVVQIYEVGSFEKGQFLVMEFVDGRGLDERFERGEDFDTARLVPLLRQLLDALDAAHATEILHRDLKPANILLADNAGDEIVKLVDFGVAKAGALLNTDDPDEGVTLVKTRAGNFVGTPRYAAPEVVVGDPPVPASDLFCVGLIAYEALVGEPLIQGNTQNELMNQLVFPRPFDLEAVSPSWRAWLEPILEKSPERRTAQAAEALRSLEASFPDYIGEPIRLDDAEETAPSDESVDNPSKSTDDIEFPTFGEAPPKTELEQTTEWEGPSPDLLVDDPASPYAATVERPPPDMSEHLDDIGERRNAQRPAPNAPDADEAQPNGVDAASVATGSNQSTDTDVANEEDSVDADQGGSPVAVLIIGISVLVAVVALLVIALI